MSGIVLLGGTGRLGRGVLKEAGDDRAVWAPASFELDLCKASVEALASVLRGRNAGVCINAAAEASVDRAEAEPAHASRLNAEGPGRLAEACRLESIPLIQISTDYLFGGPGASGAPPYREESPPSPSQVYGQTKAAGEAAVFAGGGELAHVVRVSWLFGPTAPHFLAFVQAQLGRSSGDEGEQRAPIRVFEQRSRPTYVPSLAAWLLALAAHLQRGGAAPSILHPVGGPGASRKDWAEVLLRRTGRPAPAVVEETIPASLAPRSADCTLCGEATRRWSEGLGLPPLLDWRDAPGLELLDASG